MLDSRISGIWADAIACIAEHVAGAGYSAIITSGRSGAVTLDLLRESDPSLAKLFPPMHDLGMRGNCLLYEKIDADAYASYDPHYDIMHWPAEKRVAALQADLESRCVPLQEGMLFYLDTHTFGGYKMHQVAKTFVFARDRGFPQVRLGCFVARYALPPSSGIVYGAADEATAQCLQPHNPHGTSFADLAKIVGSRA